MSDQERPVEQLTEERVAAPDGSDPFALAKLVQHRIKQCSDAAEGNTADMLYLWLQMSRQPDSEGGSAPTLEQWLNVVDEAASLGVNWLVLSTCGSFSTCESIWEIGQWAQRTYGMTIGVHTNADELTAEDVQSILNLDLERTRLFVKKDVAEGLSYLEEQGVRMGLADPQPYGDTPDCQGPGKMVFVDANGVLYTCGLVEGNGDYRLGTVFEQSFDSVMKDPALPHSVEKQIHRVSEGCDGCPALVLNFLSEKD